jgi:hypothetical protein
LSGFDSLFVVAPDDLKIREQRDIAFRDFGFYAHKHGLLRRAQTTDYCTHTG